MHHETNIISKSRIRRKQMASEETDRWLGSEYAHNASIWNGRADRGWEVVAAREEGARCTAARL
jgi:hypothetical protein